MVSNNKNIQNEKAPYYIYDMIIPGGQMAKLVKIMDISQTSISGEFLNILKFRDPNPVVVIIGAYTKRALYLLE